MKKMKVGVLGARGRLGSWLVEHHNCIPILADITVKEDLLEKLSEVRPDILINCAAYTDVNIAEVEISECISTNVLGVANILETFSGRLLVHMSSSFVFKQNTLKPLQEMDDYYWEENEILSESGIYRKSKLYAENLIDFYSPKRFDASWIIRTVGVFTPSKEHTDFAHWIYDSLQNGREIYLDNDHIRSYSYVPFLAKQILYALTYYDSYYNLIHHFSTVNSCSLLTFAHDLATTFGFDTSLIHSIEDKDRKTYHEDIRPRHSILEAFEENEELDYSIQDALDDLKERWE